MRKRLTASRKRGWRIATAIMLAFCCCAIWLPVPQLSSPEKDRSELYPCMDRPCGCASAEQCWKKCCCFTNQQKLAWAERVGVKVPDYVIAAAGQEKAQKTVAVSAPKCAHCVAASVTSATSKRMNAIRNAAPPEVVGVASGVDAKHSSACCDSEQGLAAAESAADQHQGTDDTVTGHFYGIAALECQGLTSFWQILSQTLLSEKSHPEIMGEGFSSDVPAFDVLVCGCDWPPPEPPPRIGVAGFRAVPA